MEAWKPINYTALSQEAPLFTLGFTAARWGLEPFPANLIATSNSLEDRQTFENRSIVGAGLPYDCDAELASVYDNDPPWRVLTLNGQSGIGSEFFRATWKNLTDRTTVCDSDLTCVNGGCLIVVEQAFKHTNVLVAIHIATSLVIAILTVGVLLFLRKDYRMQDRDPDTGEIELVGLRESDLINRYQRPFERSAKLQALRHLKISRPHSSSANRHSNEPSTQNWAPAQIVDVDHELVDELDLDEFARGIVRCQNLVREVARIDQAISGMDHVREDDRPRRDNLRAQGNALFDEVQRIVVTLNGISNMSVEHTAIMQAIVESISRQRFPRF